MKLPSSKTRKVVIAFTAVALVALVPAVAFAGHEESNVPSYTGCLNTIGGTINDLKLGDEPARSCENNRSEIHLSGGDITFVKAGLGLVGGGAGGAVTLGVDTSTIQKRVTGACATGQGMTQIDESGSVVCSNGPNGFRSGPIGGGGIPDDGGVLGSLSLPAGNYMVLAKVNVEQENQFSLAFSVIVRCKLHTSGSMDVSVWEADTTEFTPGTTMTMMSLGSWAAAGTADVECSDSGGAPANADAKWNALTIVAVQLDSITG